MENFNKLFPFGNKPNNGKEEIREIDGKKYRVIKTRCTCPCHNGIGIMHIAPCCNNGFKEGFIPIEDE